MNMTGANFWRRRTRFKSQRLTIRGCGFMGKAFIVSLTRGRPAAKLAGVAATGILAATLLVCSSTAALADGTTDPVQEKQALDASGQAGVPSDWDPAAQTPDVKQPSAAAVTTVAAATASRTASRASAKELPSAAASGPTGGAPSSYSLVKNEQAQQSEAWCDPASVHEALGALGISMTQAQAASALGTTSDGTAWYLGSGATYPYPTRHVLNEKVGYTFYYAVNLDYTPTSAEKSTFQTDLVSDIADGWPLVGNAYEVDGGPHLVDHPTTHNLQHFVEIRGYTTSGATTQYEDSIHGATGASWYADVPAYSDISSNTLTTIMGARGYVW